jgi:hypothetical protein
MNAWKILLYMTKLLMLHLNTLWVRIVLQAPPQGIKADHKLIATETTKAYFQMVESAVAKDLCELLNRQAIPRENQFF